MAKDLALMLVIQIHQRRRTQSSMQNPQRLLVSHELLKLTQGLLDGSPLSPTADPFSPMYEALQLVHGARTNI
eukprot:9490225-Pyramimonas_sp.AAC.1